MSQIDHKMYADWTGQPPSNRKHLLFPRAIDIIIVIRIWSFAMAKLFDLKFSPE